MPRFCSNRMNITNVSSAVSTHDFSLNGEWHVTGTEAEWAITYLDRWTGTAAEWAITYLDVTSERGYSHVVFTLHLKRRYKFYVMNIVLPCVMLSVLILIGFCLPPDAGEKISLGISVLLAFTVFLVMIADSIPRVSSAIPLIGTQHQLSCYLVAWYSGIHVERWSLTGKLSLSCARPAADG